MYILILCIYAHENATVNLSKIYFYWETQREHVNQKPAI